MSDTGFLQPIRPGSVTDQAVTVLTDLITSGRLAPNDFLPSEPELCRQLQISRSSVREALRVLEARGLVVRKHGIGVQVIDRAREAVEDSIELMLLRSGGGLRDLLELRGILESQAVVLAAARATADDIGELRDLVGELKRPGTVDEHLGSDFRFHVRLAEASQNRMLVALIHAIRGPLLRTVRAGYEADPEVELRATHHTQIVEAIAARDPKAAEAIIRRHLVGIEWLVQSDSVDWSEDDRSSVSQPVVPEPSAAKCSGD